MFSRTRATVMAVGILAAPAAAAIGAGAALAGPATSVSATALPASDSGSAYAHRGSVVATGRLGVRSFTNARDGFALASVGQAQYPASSVDGGRTWRIDGPHFHVNAANGPSVVTGSGVTGTRTYFAYAGPGGGNSVVVSSDAGAHWWRAYLPGVPLAVEPTGGGGSAGLVAIVEANPGTFQAYVSHDGGRHWQRHPGYV